MKKVWQNPLLHISQSYITLIVKIATITVATLVLFSQDVAKVLNDALQSETTSHILAMRLIFAYLFTQKKNAKSNSLIRSVKLPIRAQHQALSNSCVDCHAVTSFNNINVGNTSTTEKHISRGCVGKHFDQLCIFS